MRTPRRTHLCCSRVACIGAALLAPTLAFAAPDEIRVLSDDLTDPGDVAVELHAAGVRSRTVAGRRSLTQGLVEISYGWTQTLEISLQLPWSREPGWRGNGANVELQYVAPHDASRGIYWGARLEVGRSRGAFEDRAATAVEIRPIVGYRWGDWHAVGNASIRRVVSGPQREVVVEPSAKLTRRMASTFDLGAEYYVQAAEREAGAPALARRQLALLVADVRAGKVDLNLGVGRGIGARGDGAVLKVIAGWEL